MLHTGLGRKGVLHTCVVGEMGVAYRPCRGNGCCKKAYRRGNGCLHTSLVAEMGVAYRPSRGNGCYVQAYEGKWVFDFRPIVGKIGVGIQAF